MKPLTQRRIKLNRDLGRKGSTETPPSDRAPSGPEKTPSTSDRSAAANVSEGDRASSAAEAAGRKERSASAERGVSRERPGSAGDRPQGSDREQSRTSGQDRERDRGSDRDRERGTASERDRERGTPSERDRERGTPSDRDRERDRGSQKIAVTVERDPEAERSVRTERKNSGSGGRSVSLDKMTIAEKSSTSRSSTEPQEKPSTSSKERGEGSERSAKSHRFVHVLLCYSSNHYSYPLTKENMIQWLFKHSC